MFWKDCLLNTQKDHMQLSLLLLAPFLDTRFTTTSVIDQTINLLAYNYQSCNVVSAWPPCPPESNRVDYDPVGPSWS